MIFCVEHRAQITEAVKAWGLSHLAPFSAHEHNRRGKARLLGSKKLGDFDPVDHLVKSLEKLLEGQYAYDEDEDEDDEEAECAVCARYADNLLQLALNSTLARFHKLHGPLH